MAKYIIYLPEYNGDYAGKVYMKEHEYYPVIASEDNKQKAKVYSSEKRALLAAKSLSLKCQYAEKYEVREENNKNKGRKINE